MRGSSQKICQLTGDMDRELNQPTKSQTYSRFGVEGTDLGFSFEHNGKLYFLFGDTNGNSKFSGADSIAYTTDTNPEDCITLNFLNLANLSSSSSLAYGLGPQSNPGNVSKVSNYLPITIPGISTADYEVPSGGFSANGKMYIFYSTDHTENKIMGRSILARSNDSGKSFKFVTNISSDKFINVAPTVVNNIDVPGVPLNQGQGVLIWGSGDYRKSDPYLAYVPLNQFEDHTAWRYFSGIQSGPPSWSENESDAVSLFNQACIGELSVTWNQFLHKWLMLYNCLQPRGINFRVADQPWGPWSQEQVLFDPDVDNGYCHFIHFSWESRKCDDISDPELVNEYGGEYAPYVISRFTTGNENGTTIYFVMSTWNPYQVVLMKSTLRLE